MKSWSRLGFSLIELTVIIFVVALIVAVMLPAVQQAIESSRRAQCKDHLHKLGIALHHYHDAYRTLPPGLVARVDQTRPSDRNCTYTMADNAGKDHWASASGLTLLLPHLDEKLVWQAYNMDVGSTTLQNSTACAHIVKDFLCPSNPCGAKLIEPSYYPHWTAPTDYVLNAGVGFITCAESNVNGMIRGWHSRMISGVGPFNANTYTPMARIRDGVSNTFFVGEGAGGPRLRGCVLGSDERGLAAAMFPENCFVDQPWALSVIPSAGDDKACLGGGSIFGATAMNPDYNIDSALGPIGLVPHNNGANWMPLPLNFNEMKCGLAAYYSKSYPGGIEYISPGKQLEPIYEPGKTTMTGFRSYHRGICHFLYADGRVGAIAGAIDSRVYVALGSIFGNE